MSHFSPLLEKIKKCQQSCRQSCQTSCYKTLRGGQKKGSGRLAWSALKKCDRLPQSEKEPHSHQFLNAFIDTKTLQQCVNAALRCVCERAAVAAAAGNNTISHDPPSLLSAAMATAALRFRRHVLTDVRFWAVLLWKESVWEWEAPRSPRDHQSACKWKTSWDLGIPYLARRATVLTSIPPPFYFFLLRSVSKTSA